MDCNSLQEEKASHASTATIAAAAGDAYHIANDATGGVRAAPEAASANGAVPTAIAASTGESEAPTTIVGDTATTTDYITGYQATPAVRRDIARAAGADGGPPFDRAATLNTGGGVSARNITTVSVQTGEISTTKDVTDDARRRARREELGIRADPAITAAATKDGVSDARREWAATRGAPGRLMRLLRGLGGPDSPSRQLPSPTPPAVLRRPPRQGGDRPTLPGTQSDRTSRRSRQKSTPTAQRRGYGRGDGVGTTREAG